MKTAFFVALLSLCSASFAQQSNIYDPLGQPSVIQPYQERDPYPRYDPQPFYNPAPPRVDIYTPYGNHRGTGRVEGDFIINEQTGRREGIYRP